MSKRKNIEEEKKKRLVKDIKHIARKLQGPVRPTYIEQTKKRVSRSKQKVIDKGEVE